MGYAIGHEVRRQREPGLSALQEHRLRERLRREAPSEPWVEAQFRTFDDVDERGRAIVRRCHDPRLFPPGGSRTAMVKCPACGVWTPPNALEGGRCLDHGVHEGWGPSPSAEAIRGLQHYNLRIEETTLAPESTTALKREIRKFQHAERRKAKAAGGRPSSTRAPGNFKGHRY